MFAQEPHSAADIAQAREFLREGLALRAKGDAAGALEKFKVTHALAGTPISGIELGRAYMAVGKLIEARETFLSVGRTARRAEETAKSEAARTESAQLADELKSRIPRLTVKVTGVTIESVSVTIDGAVVPTEALAAPRFLNPGGHDVAARSTSGGTAETRVELSEGDARELELKLIFSGEASPSVAAPPPASSASPMASSPVDVRDAGRPTNGNTQRVAGLVVGGVGIVGLGVAGILGLVAKAQQNTAETETGAARHDDSQNAVSMSNVATAVVGIGAAVTIVGGVVWFTAPRARVFVATNGHEVFLQGRF